MSRTVAEMAAFVDGAKALDELQKTVSDRRRAMGLVHRLRVAARLDPSAAYNLGSILSDSAPTARDAHGRLIEAADLFARAATMCFERLDPALVPFKASDPSEAVLRDLVSRAKTNLGAHVANLGMVEEATRQFAGAIMLFPDNANAHICLGRMAVFHWRQTGLDPIDGVESWKKGAELGGEGMQPEDDNRLRRMVVTTVDRILRTCGEDEARAWMAGPMAASLARLPGKPFGIVVPDPEDVSRVGGRDWPLAYTAAGAFHEFTFLYRDAEEADLPMRLSMAASLLARILLVGESEDPGRVLRDAVAFVEGFEPMKPWVGDGEWEPFSGVRVGAQEGVVDAMTERAAARMADEGPLAGAIAVLLKMDAGLRGEVVRTVMAALDGGGPARAFVPVESLGPPPAGWTAPP